MYMFDGILSFYTFFGNFCRTQHPPKISGVPATVCSAFTAIWRLTNLPPKSTGSPKRGE